MKTLPKLTYWQIFNLSFGFLGVQIGYSLQSAFTSRILSTLGANIEHLSYFWLAAPFAGLIVQPIIGMSSDKTWTRMGRRIPFIFGGAFAATAAMFFLPNSAFFAYLLPPLFFGAFMFLFMDVSFNVTMQPFRALVGDMVSEEQRNLGYSVQSLLICIGAVIGSFLPTVLTWLGVSNTPPPGKVASSVIWAFIIGGAALLLSVLWTAFRTREYSPEEYAQYHNISEKEKEKISFWQLLKEIPTTMWRLAIVQFFSWFALFLMWVYTTLGVAQNVWHTSAGDTSSANYNTAGNWVGVIFGFYSILAALFSLVIPRFADKYGRKPVYMVSLILGGVGLASMVMIHNQWMLMISMIGVGIAWAAILSMPFAILSAALPASKMGVYMGLFNATVTIPQIAAGFLGGVIVKILGGKAIMMLGVAGLSMFLAGIAVVFIKEKFQQVNE